METVIKGLEECTGKGHCTECLYGKERQTLSCKKLLADALTLLKEQQKLIDGITQRRANNGAFD